MKYRDPVTGEFKDITVKVADTLPVGTIVEYDGDVIPSGWEEVNGISTITVNDVNFIKIGRLVQVKYAKWEPITWPGFGNTKICDIPEGYRPCIIFLSPALAKDSKNDYTSQLSFNCDKNALYINNGAGAYTSAGIYGSFCYITRD